MMQSKSFTLNKVDLIKLVKSAGLAGMGVAILFFLEAIGQADLESLGPWAAPVAAMASFAFNFFRKLFNGPASV